jgi:aminopeptidase-like protein
MMTDNIGIKIHNLGKKIWPFNRSLTGEGVLKTFNELKKINSTLKIHKIASGKKVFDWRIPDEWNVKEAYIIDPSGKKICDFKKNNLHLVGYSIPVEAHFSLKDLNKYLHSIPEKPTAIPYVTSYYTKSWGFCMTDNQRRKLKLGKYKVIIKSTLKKGFLHYGEILIKGKTKKEILLSTYVCHPSLANNEVSGPIVTIFLSKWLKELKNKKYSYRIVFVPETIGSIAYLSRNIKYMKKNIFAGFTITCVGDDRCYSYLPSRNKKSLSDKVAKHILKNIDKNFKQYSWEDRGSDERQYCAPGVDLPVATIMRSRPGSYPEYHTSLDNLVDVVTPKGLAGGFNVLQKTIEAVNQNFYPLTKTICEPFLAKRNLYPTAKDKPGSAIDNLSRLIIDTLTWCDGSHDLIDIAEEIGIPVWKLYPIIKILREQKLIKK